VRDELSKLRRPTVCPECHGARLREAARHVLIGNPSQQATDGGLAIYEIEAMPLALCLQWFDNLVLHGSRQEIADRIIREIRARLVFLNDVGLTYLSLDRSANTISGGESQRIRLASQIGS